jgi:hypothetical protein
MTRHVDEQQQQLAPGEQDLLAGIRRILGPSPSDQARVRRGVSACLAAGATAPELPASLLGARRGAGSGPSYAGLQGLGKQVIAAVAIGAAGFGAGLATGRVGQVEDARVVPVAAPARSPESPRAMSSPGATADPVPEEPALPGDAPPTLVEAPRASGSAPNGRAADARSVTEEADALRRVGQALREGQPQMAGQMLDDLDARIPRGALGEERHAARLMVRCRTGEPGAPAVARAWLARHGRSVYAPRVRGSCDERTPPGEDPQARE